MKIGVDAGALSITDNRLKLGVYWVNVNLLRELRKIDTTNTYYLYSFAPIEKELMKDFGSRMENKVLRPRRGWFSVRLPIELAAHPVDVFLGLSQAIPISQSRNIGFVYDLGFFHYPEAYPGSHKKLVSITTNLIRRSHTIITISRVVKEDVMKRFGVSEEKITVAYPGVDETFTLVGPKHKEKNPYFLFVGALKRGKNIPTLIKAFRRFLKQVKKDTGLVLVGGDYWPDPEIPKTINNLKLHSRVKQLDFVPDSKLAALYRGAVAFVSPSLWEGFCLPAVEAMACGTPVIGSTTGSFPEVVGEAGILVDPKDEKALTRALISIATDSKLRSKLSQRAITQAKRFRWETFAKLVYKLL